MSIDVIKRPYTCLRGGKRFYYDTMDMSHVTLQNIASALAKENRFGGWTPRPYSVAEHQLLCDWIFREDIRKGLATVSEKAYTGARMALLMHDAHEAFTKDMPSPVKAILPEYRAFEARVETALHDRFGIYSLMDLHARNTRYYDLRALNTERVTFGLEADLPDSDWPSLKDYPAANFDAFLSNITSSSHGWRSVAQLWEERVEGVGAAIPGFKL